MVHIRLVTVMFHPFQHARPAPVPLQGSPALHEPDHPSRRGKPRFPADPPPRTGPRLPRDIKVMLVAAFLIALGFGLVAPVLPQFATTFDVGATAAAVIVSIFAFMRLRVRARRRGADRPARANGRSTSPGC